MNVFLTTVAGLSSRFSASLGREVLKCIYYETDPQKTLLYRQLKMAAAYDCLAVVGGYRFEELCRYVECQIAGDIRKKVLLVNNRDYARYGSGWSLLRGLSAVRDLNPQEILFAEGDLAFGWSDFQRIIQTSKDVITFTQGPVHACTSVAVYLDADGCPHYLYDVQHGLLQVEEPFRSIFNSGQIWKFADPALLYTVMDKLPESIQQKTNLELINAYFAERGKDVVSFIPITEWVNCNTVSEFETVKWEENYGD